MPDPKLFEANFYDLDTNGDGKINAQEFKDYFSEAEPQVLETLDLSGDQVVDREEWRKFEEAPGAKTKQREPPKRSQGTSRLLKKAQTPPEASGSVFQLSAGVDTRFPANRSSSPCRNLKLHLHIPHT